MLLQREADNLGLKDTRNLPTMVPNGIFIIHKTCLVCLIYLWRKEFFWNSNNLSGEIKKKLLKVIAVGNGAMSSLETSIKTAIHMSALG